MTLAGIGRPPTDAKAGAVWCRSIVLVLTIGFATALSITFGHVLAADGITVLDIIHLAVFVGLSIWLSINFTVQLIGGTARIANSLRRSPEQAESRSRRAIRQPNCAIVMPIHNEDPAHVFAAILAIWDDLADLPERSRMDMLILSDTRDHDIWAQEVRCFDRLRAMRPDAPFYYRRRPVNLRRKPGNIEDFVAESGGHYGYMIVLDADSLLSGDAIATLLRRMDGDPSLGLLQAPTRVVHAETAFARLQQFGSYLFGPNATKGLGLWSGRQGNYFGHNAIIRMAAFRDCGLPTLPGRPPLGGDVRSHDFVEAALMVRRGWSVELATDIRASYEGAPPGLEDYALRDRRWCQGNFQHLYFITAPGMNLVSRGHLANGILSYAASPIWLLFLALSITQVFAEAMAPIQYFDNGSPFPEWPLVTRSSELVLLAAAGTLLFAPKLLGLVGTLLEERASLRRSIRLTGGLAVDVLSGALLAPIMMILHTRFVLSVLVGQAIDWQSQRRRPASSSWRRRIDFCRLPMIAGGVFVALSLVGPNGLLTAWLAPIYLPLLLSPFLIALCSSRGVGGALTRSGLMTTPEDTAPPPVLRRFQAALDGWPPANGSIMEVIRDPHLNSLWVELLRPSRSGAPSADGDDTRSGEWQDGRSVLESPVALRLAHARYWLGDEAH